MKTVKVMVVILTTHERTGWVCKELAEYLVDLGYNSRGYQLSVGFAHNFIPAASARNHSGRIFEDSQYDWLCMIDNDMAPPSNLLDTVKDAPEDAGIVCPIFHLWDQSKAHVTSCWGRAKDEESGNGFIRLPIGFQEIEKAGTGVMFIRRGVLSKIPFPWFTYEYNEEGGLIGTEDIAMCHKARAAGVKIYGNSSIQVGHYKSVDLQVLSHAWARSLDIVGKNGVESPSEELVP